MHRSKDNIKMNLQEVESERAHDWLAVAQDTDRWQTLVNALINHRIT